MNERGLPPMPGILESRLLQLNKIMNLFRIIWDDPDDPNGNVQHVAEHGFTIEDIEDVLSNPTSEGTSASSGRPCVWGYTVEGIYIIVVYDNIDPDTIRVVTAYEVPEPR